MSTAAPENNNRSVIPQVATRTRCNMATGVDLVTGALLGLLCAVGLRLLPVSEEMPGYVAVGVFVAYFFFANSLPGDSLGMRLFGMRVLSIKSGRGFNPLQSFVRTLLYPFHLGDVVARTQVVLKAPLAPVLSTSERPVGPR
jgi:hypothetical protein